jgi:cytochrome c oxidase subunit II
VQPAEFEQWVAHQKSNAVYPVAAATPATTPGAQPAVPPVPSGAGAAPMLQEARQREQPQAKPGLSNQAPQTAPLPAPTAPAAVAVWAFPREKLPPHTIPSTPLPTTLAFDDATLPNGDPARGMQVYTRGGCIGCHKIAGNPMSAGVLGPNLTHVGTRWTIAAGLYPNDAKHLARWIKNAPLMKPGSLMPTIGRGQRDPSNRPTIGNLSDAEIADVVAYLMALK